VDKHALHRELVAALAAEHEKLAAAQKATAEGATHAEARAEGSKDTRATEASYLARGQALRAAELAAELATLESLEVLRFGPADAIQSTALVALKGPSGRLVVYVAPAGGGVRLAGGVQVVTPSSPVGRAIVGAAKGDVVEVERGGRLEEFEILSIE
jgi:hypothetical protein